MYLIHSHPLSNMTNPKARPIVRINPVRWPFDSKLNKLNPCCEGSESKRTCVSTKVGCETVDWIHLAQSKVQCHGSCKHGYEYSDSTNGGELTGRRNVIYPTTTLLRGFKYPQVLRAFLIKTLLWWNKNKASFPCTHHEGKWGNGHVLTLHG